MRWRERESGIVPAGGNWLNKEINIHTIWLKEIGIVGKWLIRLEQLKISVRPGMSSKNQRSQEAVSSNILSKTYSFCTVLIVTYNFAKKLYNHGKEF